MKVYTGIDIIEVARIRENIENYKDKFAQRVYTDREIDYCESKKVQKYESYAGRFAGKEAVFKAISGLLENKSQINWKDIEILNDESGRPYVNLNKSKLSESCEQDVDNVLIDVSISHVRDMAVASATVMV